MGLLARIFKRHPKPELSELEFVQTPVCEAASSSAESFDQPVESPQLDSAAPSLTEPGDVDTLPAPLDEATLSASEPLTIDQPEIETPINEQPVVEPLANEQTVNQPVIQEQPIVEPLAQEQTVDEASAKTESLLMGLTMGSGSAGPSLSARAVSAIDGTEAMAADDPRHYRDPIVDELIMKLMDEAHQRADAAVGAYERLGAQTSEYARRSRRTARRAWSLTGTLALVIAVGGTWSGFTIGRQSTLVENLRQKVSENADVAAQRDLLRSQLADTRSDLFKAQLALDAAQLAKIRAEAQTIFYQCRLQFVEQTRAALPATQPAAAANRPAAATTQPAAAVKPVADTWASLLGQ